MIFDIGPLHLYRVDKDGTLDISLKCMGNWPCGWEYGWKDSFRGKTTPLIEFRIGKLMIFYLEFWTGGCEVWFMGFWAIPSWKKENK